MSSILYAKWLPVVEVLLHNQETLEMVINYRQTYSPISI